MSTFKLGRNRPPHDARRRFHMRNYSNRALLPPPPSKVDYSAQAGVALTKVYLNDELGCCVIAGIGHVAGVITGNVGDPTILTADDVMRLYKAIGKYPPDNGCDERTALDYWKANGLAADGSHKIAGWMSVNGADPVEVRQALWLFENLVFGVELPDRWVNPMPSADGFIWDLAGAPLEENGHCFVAAGYDPEELDIFSWGLHGKITNAAVAKYATTVGSGELYCVLSDEMIDKAKGKSPSGFDFGQLQADFAAFSGGTA